MEQNRPRLLARSLRKTLRWSSFRRSYQVLWWAIKLYLFINYIYLLIFMRRLLIIVKNHRRQKYKLVSFYRYVKLKMKQYNKFLPIEMDPYFDKNEIENTNMENFEWKWFKEWKKYAQNESKSSRWFIS